MNSDRVLDVDRGVQATPDTLCCALEQVSYFVHFCCTCLTIYLIETPFTSFPNRADLDQAALLRAA